MNQSSGYLAALRKTKMERNRNFVLKNITGVPDYQVTKFAEKSNRTALLIPVLNEGQRIIVQLEEMKRYSIPADIVIADGGSTDGLLELLVENDLNVVTFLVKLGEGQLSSQLRMGFHFCLESGYESVITMDGNNKDNPAGVETINKALRNNADYVQGSRFVKGGKAVNTPLLRYLAIRFLHAPITSFGAKFWYTDTTNGFRGFSRKLLTSQEISIFRNVFQSYELLAYLPIRAKQVGLKVIEVPVTRAYPLGEKTPTKIRGFRAQINLLKILIKAVKGSYNPAVIVKRN